MGCLELAEVRIVHTNLLMKMVDFLNSSLSQPQKLVSPPGRAHAFHASCCEVAWEWMSGAGECIMDIETKMGDPNVFANFFGSDGSAVDFLATLAHIVGH